MGRGMLCATPVWEALLCVWYAPPTVSSRGRGKVYRMMPSIFDFPGADKVVIEDEALAKGFTIIPNIVFKRPDLSAYGKLIYMALLSYAWQQDSCFPGQERLATELGLSVRTVRRAIRELQDCGLLRVTQRGQGKTNVYTLTKLS